MADTPSKTTRFKDGGSVEVEVNGEVVGRVVQRPESTLTAEDDAALALEVDQLVDSMNELLRDVHEIQSEGGEDISAEIVAHRDDAVEIIENPPEATRFEDPKYIEIKRDDETIARVEHRPAPTLTDSEMAGFNLILEGMVEDIEEKLDESYGRTPYEMLSETGSSVEINISGKDGWITRIE